MKIGMVNKLTIMNRFVLHTLQHNITHLTVITLKTNINIDILKGGGGKSEKRAEFCTQAIFFQKKNFCMQNLVFFLRI